jgi:hypothetical protein
MGRTAARALGLALALTASWALEASGAGVDLETLVMPGPVIEGHADVEADCSSCHRPFDRAAEDGLCLECHEEVAADRKTHTGFHALAPGIIDAPCRTCHSDHQGRDADVVGLNPALFDHERTDYPLRGAHTALACDGCHPSEQKHREASSLCIDCHRDDDPHREQLGVACGDCHVEKSWKEAPFDHSKTEFPLEGAHAEVACGLCHADERYEGTPSDCASCHRLDDVHQGEFGTSCETCHEVDTWDTPRFDHDRETDFPLEGKHEGLDCGSCHTASLYEDALETDCLSCHQPDDVHRGRFGPTCETCHEAGAWSNVRFDHDRDTGFPLAGSHPEVRCEGCHEGTLYQEELGTDCISCHRQDDVHRGQQGERCETCHSENSWEGQVSFDHEITRFPLLGLHAAVACQECHVSPAFRDAETDCVACHLPDDTHERRLGEACGVCHNPNDWRVWRFDHDAGSTFALHGAHEGLDCQACHDQPVVTRIELSHDCTACHAAEDVHRGEFGRDCSRCHAERAWDEVELPR